MVSLTMGSEVVLDAGMGFIDIVRSRNMVPSTRYDWYGCISPIEEDVMMYKKNTMNEVTVFVNFFSQ